MESIINLEDMPQLVLEKITSLLYLKELLTLEQVSKKLKCAVDEHFSITDHLIIGCLPEVEDEVGYREATAKDKKCLDAFLKIIKRCGKRLRTIYVLYRLFGDATRTYYDIYLRHIFASAAMSDNCPNVENIIAFPKLAIITNIDNNMFPQQNILLEVADAEIYANKVKKIKGQPCKLRSISLPSRQRTHVIEHLCKRILNLFSNLEQIVVYDDHENFVKFLPQFINSGLKDLQISDTINISNAKKYCNIGKKLRTLRIHTIQLDSDDDIADLNKLQLPKNLEFGIYITCFGYCHAQLSENVCNFINRCKLFLDADRSSISKLKNLREFCISNLDELKAIAEGSFPELQRITNGNGLCDITDVTETCNLHYSYCSCHRSNKCDLQIFLPQLLISKGNQLIFIDILTVCTKSVEVVWKALKYCKAAEIITVAQFFVDSQLTVTYEDVRAICHLLNLQVFEFGIIPERREKDEDYRITRNVLPELMERAVAEHTDLQFKYDVPSQKYSLRRINF